MKEDTRHFIDNNKVKRNRCCDSAYAINAHDDFGGRDGGICNVEIVDESKVMQFLTVFLREDTLICDEYATMVLINIIW